MYSVQVKIHKQLDCNKLSVIISLVSKYNAHPLFHALIQVIKVRVIHEKLR